MSHIVVHITSYKSKNLLECFKSINDNLSGENTVQISILDLNNLNRSKNFPNINYQYMIWDKQISKFSIRENIANTTSGDYFFALDQSFSFTKDWDKKMIELQNGDEILSGSHGISFVEPYKFVTKYSEHDIFEKTLTNFVSPKFLFCKLSTFRGFPSLTRLKHFGESEVLSFFANQNNIQIYAVPTEMFTELDQDISKQDYLPFSLNHNYNLVLDMIKGKGNVFFDSPIDVDKISKKIGYDFKRLSYHPFQQNDIEYSVETSLDELGGTKFFGGVRSIY